MENIVWGTVLALALIVIGWNIGALRRVEARITALERALSNVVGTTHDLNQRVERLAVAVDQSPQQLHRALELSSHIHHLIYGTLHGSDGITTDAIGTVYTYLIELNAIAVVNGDTDFIERVGMLRQAVEFLVTHDPDQPTPTITVSQATEGVQRMVYDLLARATRRG